MSALARGNINRDLFSGTYVRTYVRSVICAGAYEYIGVNARIQYRLGACETRFIAFATLNATF